MYSASHKLKRRRKRRLFFRVTFLFVLIVVGGVVAAITSFFPLSGVDESVRSAGGVVSSPSLPVDSAVVRGRIFDRNFQELAVSYKLFSLYASPAKINNHFEVSSILAALTGKSSQDLLDLLRKPKRVIEIADNLDPEQAQKIKELSLDGLYLKGFEERFYPQYATAAHVIGYVSDGMGLAGMERQFDLFLQAGGCQANMVPDVDFQEYTYLGRKGADLILTIDIGLQKKINRYLSVIMAERNADLAMGLLLDPRTAKVLSISSLPSFDGNSFWNASEMQLHNRVFSPVLDKELIRPILVRAAAIMQNDSRRELLLPATVATPDFGLDGDAVNEITQRLGFKKPVYGGALPVRKVTGQTEEYRNDDLISLAQVGVGMASLINGGWRIAPTFLDSVYDLEKKELFSLNSQAIDRKLVVSPVTGVALRRHMLAPIEKNGMVVFTGRSVRDVPAGGSNRYIQQEFFGGLVRGEGGRSLLLLLAVEKNNLTPLEKERKSLKEHGRSLLADLYIAEQREQKVAVHPPDIDKENKERFLISRQIEDTTPIIVEKRLTEMPMVVGSSLREGLQALSRRNCRVVVRGIGRIVSQYPPPGHRLQAGEECIIDLQKNI
jgi:cell division protein FtsI (penicillin-binding protein 3)